MRIKAYIQLLFSLLITTDLLLCSDAKSQTGDTVKTINFPLPYEDFSLYDFAEISDF